MRRQSAVTGSNTTLYYGDNVVKSSDINLLQGPNWLSDTLISFYYEYLESRVFTTHLHLLCVPPQVTQCMKHARDHEIGVFLEPLDASSKEIILFALNDSTEDGGSGNHWSLLVYSKPDRAVFHFDSSKGHNKAPAKELSNKLMAYFKVPSKYEFIEYDCLQQTNIYDCGVHVLCNTEMVLEYAAKSRTIAGCPKITQDKIDGFRLKLLKIIWRIKHSSRSSTMFIP